MSGIQVNLLKLVMEFIIYSEGQSFRIPFGKNKEVAFPYIYIYIHYVRIIVYIHIYPDAFPSE